MKASARGSWAELQASSHFMKRGWQVFTAMDPQSPADIVVVKNGRVRLIDVKYRRGGRSPSGRSLNRRQKDLGVEIVHVLNNGEVLDEELAAEAT